MGGVGGVLSYWLRCVEFQESLSGDSWATALLFHLLYFFTHQQNVYICSMIERFIYFVFGKPKPLKGSSEPFTGKDILCISAVSIAYIAFLWWATS